MSSLSAQEQNELRKQLAEANARIADLEKKLQQLTVNTRSQYQATKISSDAPQESADFLRRSKNRYRKYFNYATDAMFVILPDKGEMNFGKFIDVNKEATRRLGYSRDEFFNMCPQDINLPDQVSSLSSRFKKLYRDGNAIFESLHVSKSGKQIPVEINTLLLHVNGEELILAGARDITERKIAERNLMESERLYRLLADNVHDVIWTTDTTLKPIFISPSITSLSSHEPAEALPILYRSIILESPLFEYFRRKPYKTKYTPIHWEIELTKKDGSNIWVESIAAPIWDVSGTFTGIIGVTRDITPRKTIMIELETAREQANNANNAKSEFLANMSHEIRTPMNGVLGTLQLLGLTDLSTEQRQYVETALKSGQSLLTIMNDILDFSKIEAGKIEIRSEAFSPRDVITSLIASFQVIAKSPNITLTCQVDPDVPEMIVADHTRFRQILSNLIGNSLKFTEKGKITTSLRVSKKLTEKKILLECTVNDTGIGLPDHYGLDLFDPFSQVEESIRKKYKGTGLGLSIVKQLVTLMGGTVTIAGRENQGTRVIFEIEASLTEQQATRVENKSQSVIKITKSIQQNILLVEDDLINQQILRSVLEKLGHQVTIVHNGKLALQAVVDNVYDFVLMDIQMPEMDGLEATRRIRTDSQYSNVANIPIVALTAFAMTGDKEKCLKAGMNDYLSKPVDVSALQKILHHHGNC